VNVSTKTGKIVLACVAVGVVCALAWAFSGSKSEADFDQSVICSSCGHFSQVMLSNMDLRARQSPGPDFGPGAPCPKCGKTTLYANPIVCEKCSNKFMTSRSPAGAAVGKCPKCDWTR
jgi:hypothetical protein